MKKEKFEEIIKELELEKHKWLDLYEIESIMLAGGRGIYPDWRHLRFYIDDNEIYIKHGMSSPYGAKLTTNYSMRMGGTSISFDVVDFIPPTKFYNTFKLPKVGDMIRMTSGNKLIAETMITSFTKGFNIISIDIATPFPIGIHGLISFYDPEMIRGKNSDFCMHSAPEQGIFMYFNENPGKSYKNLGVFHEKIKIKDIESISLNVLSKFGPKKYNIRG